jgi:exopolysaccharide production protein ExoY
VSERRPFLFHQRQLARAKEPLECIAIAAHEPWWRPNAMHGPPVGGFGKRLVDITVASLALVLLSPLMVLIAAAVRFTMGGPVLFGHGRIGHSGRTFRCYKFRTMIVGADDVLREYLANNPQAAKEWRETRKLRNDPRITLLGHFLRKTSIDELPQLINVLRGDMSCVGPRPIVADELAHYGENASEYLHARPGLTGAWQVSGRTSLRYAERVALDVEYVRDWSIWKDICILVRTIPAVMHFDNAS